jgi:hypothetical protein
VLRRLLHSGCHAAHGARELRPISRELADLWVAERKESERKEQELAS